MVLSHERSPNSEGLLYPLLLIAAIAVIVFSVVSIATVAGWWPNALRSSTVSESGYTTPSGANSNALVAEVRAAPTFGCVECGVIESVRNAVDGTFTPAVQHRAEHDTSAERI